MSEMVWRSAVVTAAYLVIGLSGAYATILNPQLSVRPVVPSTSDVVALRILDATGVGASVDSVGTTIQGNVIEIAAQITLGSTDIMAYYQIDQSAGVLPEGRNAVRYVAQVRGASVGGVYPPYTAPFVAGAWEFVVLNPGNQTAAIEYYYGTLNHYFLTSNPVEINKLDTGGFPGWVRTGQQIGVVASGDAASTASTVCRFYGNPAKGLDSHFYSASAEECAAVIAKYPDAWLLESSNVFRSYVPDTNGVCPINLTPVFRLYNNRADVNHRYTTSTGIKQEMIAAGWIPEGVGPNAVVWCAVP
ncbi:MAG: hypothetical protein ABI886_03155 [Betaproteobacteria bacterium]